MSNLPNRLRHALSSGRYKLNYPYKLAEDRAIAADLLVQARRFNRRINGNDRKWKSWSKNLYVAASYAYQEFEETGDYRYEHMAAIMNSTSGLNDLYR